MKKTGVLFWKTTDEYVAFTRKHNVFGAEAIKLKKKMEKQVIPLPRINYVQTKIKDL